MTRNHALWLMLVLGCSHERIELLPGVAPVPRARPSPQTREEPLPPLIGTSATAGASGTVPASDPVTVTRLPTAAVSAPPAISGGTLVIAHDGSRAVATDPDRNNAYVVDLHTRAVTAVPFPSGSEPGRLVLDDSGHAHVALRGGSSIARIDLARPSGSLMLSTPGCQYPRGLAFDRARNALAVACTSGELVLLAADSYVELQRSFLAVDLRDVVITSAGRSFVSRYRSAELLVLKEQQAISANTSPRQQALNALSPSSPVPMTSPGLAWRLIEGPGGAPMMLHQRLRNDALSLGIGGYAGNADTEGCLAASRPALTIYDHAGQPRISLLLGADVTLAVDMAISADGGQLAIVDAGRGVTAPSAQVIALAAAPTAPWPTGACGPSVSRSLLTSGQATAVAFDAAGLIYVQSRQPALLEAFSLDDAGDTSNRIKPRWSLILSVQSARDAGHDLFHTDLGAQISCASCHGEALDDGHVWLFRDLGLRRTKSLRGAIDPAGLQGWGGEISTASAFIAAEVTRMHGSSGSAWTDLQTAELTLWLISTPTLHLPPRPQTEIARGLALFESGELGCAQCHDADDLPNNQVLDVGTRGAFKVPMLRGLGLRPPYMHDGCAPQLESTFDARCGGLHSRAAQLPQEQRAALLSYLESF